MTSTGEREISHCNSDARPFPELESRTCRGARAHTETPAQVLEEYFLSRILLLRPKTSMVAKDMGKESLLDLKIQKERP